MYRENTYIEVLDSTRIHPETYVWARKMAVDALEIEEVSQHRSVLGNPSHCHIYAPPPPPPPPPRLVTRTIPVELWRISLANQTS